MSGKSAKAASSVPERPPPPRPIWSMQLEAGMALGDMPELGHMAAGREADRQRFALARGPEPIERAVRPPFRLMRLVEGEAEAEHAGAPAPVANDLLAIRGLEVEMPEDAELIGVRLDRRDRLPIDR